MRTLHFGEQVFVIAQSPLCHPAVQWFVDRPERGSYRCWRHDGHGGRISEVFAADELETLDERNQRGAEHDRLQEQEWDRITCRKRPRPPSREQVPR